MEFSRRLLSCATGLLIFGLTGTAHAAETGWEYSRHVDEFDDATTHFASSGYIKNGETFDVSVVCYRDKKLLVWFNPGHYSARFLSTVSVDVRVDKNPKQTFDAEWVAEFASLAAETKGVYRFISELMYGSKLIFRVRRSGTVTIWLNGSFEPIDKVLNACNAP